MKTLEELQKICDEKERLIGVLQERNRILDGIDKANLPAGVWLLIEHIICPLEEGIK